MKQVKIKISPTGDVNYEVVGYQNNECAEVRNIMLQVGEVHNERPTGEGCQPATQPAFNEIGINRINNA